jgi:hypothetical protein
VGPIAGLDIIAKRNISLGKRNLLVSIKKYVLPYNIQDVLDLV